MAERPSVNEKFDIMISYNWVVKEMIVKIKERLEQDGYKVWLDEEQMDGNMYDRMREAIDNSSCIVVCMTDDYKKSECCKLVSAGEL
jgi:hypothetical protein